MIISLALAILLNSGGLTPPLPPTDLCPQGCILEAEVLQEAHAALHGASRSARNLSMYFASENDIDEAVYWAAVALENGDEAFRYNYAFLLAKRGTQRDIVRAIYHLGLAEKMGVKEAMSLRLDLEKKISVLN